MKEKPQLYSHAVAYFHCKTITSFTLHNLLHTSNRLPNLQIQKIITFIIITIGDIYISFVFINLFMGRAKYEIQQSNQDI